MKLLTALIASLMLMTGMALAADPVNKLCPVSGKAGDPSVTTEYSKTVKFCCEKCKAKFDKEPKAFGKEIAAYKADDKKCLLCDNDAVAAQTSEFKADISTCCNNCKGKVVAAPDKYIEKALKK